MDPKGSKLWLCLCQADPENGSGFRVASLQSQAKRGTLEKRLGVVSQNGGACFLLVSQKQSDQHFGACCLDVICQLLGFSIKPLEVKLSAGEQKATEKSWHLPKTRRSCTPGGRCVVTAELPYQLDSSADSVELTCDASGYLQGGGPGGFEGKTGST